MDRVMQAFTMQVQNTAGGPKITGQMVELWNGHTVAMKGQPNNLKIISDSQHDK
jgi:hypothetical protein